MEKSLSICGLVASLSVGCAARAPETNFVPDFSTTRPAAVTYEDMDGDSSSRETAVIRYVRSDGGMYVLFAADDRIWGVGIIPPPYSGDEPYAVVDSGCNGVRNIKRVGPGEDLRMPDCDRE